MSSNKFEALVISDDSDNSDANIGESGKTTGMFHLPLIFIQRAEVFLYTSEFREFHLLC